MSAHRKMLPFWVIAALAFALGIGLGIGGCPFIASNAALFTSSRHVFSPEGFASAITARPLTTNPRLEP